LHTHFDWQTKSMMIHALPEKPFQTSSPLLSCLSFCKGIAITGVLLSHYFAVDPNPGWQGVHVFIILSGFGLTYACLQRRENWSWRQWYSKRLRRILPVYWLVVLLGYLLMVGIYLSEGKSWLEALSNPKRVLFVQLTLLGNFFYGTVMTAPNVSLWFVAFIVSFYAVFPWLYHLITQRRTLKGLTTAFLVLLAGELIYRAIVIQGLDAFPIGGELLFDRVPDWFPFQREAPFGCFAARVGEFGLGMIAAVMLSQNQKSFQKMLFNHRALICGVGLWVAGNALLKIQLWGWIFSDFVIGLGLILWLLNLAHFAQQNLPRILNQVSKLGDSSYYIYLVHYPFIYISTIYLTERTGVQLNLFFADSWRSFALGCLVLGVNIAAIWLSSRLLQRFDAWPALDKMARACFRLQPQPNRR
jgi:peptidoglycan/LPS O-acetylase OafA/YrhL